MMIRTHLAITFLAILLFLPHISSEFVFISVALLSTFLPDIDIPFSTLGKHKGFRFLQNFTQHRGLFHSFSFCILVSFILAFFIPVATLPFFLGYGLHLFADSFTVEGIKPFWPYKGKSSWTVKTGGLKETSIFVFLVLIDFVLVIFSLEGFMS